MSELERKKYITIAYELGYSTEVLTTLYNAKSEKECEKILRSARTEE